MCCYLLKNFEDFIVEKMNFDRDPSSTDDYLMTAVQIFDCCGVERSGALRVDALMDKFAPIVKTNKADFSFLNALMDPEQCNPEINVTKLANALHKYSETQKTKMDLDESFNLKGGQVPQDSDSGISSDGLQLLEELQGELKEKEHLAHQLRTQLDFTDKQHEEALAALTAERDSLIKHLNIVREENSSLSSIRRDYDETSERLSIAESSLAAALTELEQLRRRNHHYTELQAELHSDIETLQELLAKSKAECHRINEMYASRQSALLEQNETLKAENAELTSRLQDQEDYMQEIIKEKVLVEMELKDLLNKSNQTHLRLDRSIDVSYTEDQMLSALDTLNADSRFANDQTSVSTQVDEPCVECEKRNAVTPHRALRRFFWEPLKCLFQVFAVICFICAVVLLCGAVSRGGSCRASPWAWLHAQELMDLLLRIEYTADVPM